MSIENDSFDRKLQGQYINSKLKELNDFCRVNGIECNLHFGGGFESKSKLVTQENGELKWEFEGHTRTYTTIGLKITLSDSDKGDNVNLLEGIMQALLDNIKPK